MRSDLWVVTDLNWPVSKLTPLINHVISGVIWRQQLWDRGTSMRRQTGGIPWWPMQEHWTLGKPAAWHTKAWGSGRGTGTERTQQGTERKDSYQQSAVELLSATFRNDNEESTKSSQFAHLPHVPLHWCPTATSSRVQFEPESVILKVTWAK